MDLFNNATGREIAARLGPQATDRMIATAVAVMLGSDLLITRPEDVALHQPERSQFTPQTRSIILDRIAENVLATHELTSAQEPSNHS